MVKRRAFLKSGVVWSGLLWLPRAIAQQAALSPRVAAFSSPTASAATPDYGGEVQRGSELGSSNSTTTITLSGGVSAGNRAVLLFRWYLNTQTISSVTDSRGNTWTVDKTLTHDTNNYHAIISAHVGTALQAGDTITITFSASASSYRAWCLVYLTGVASSSAVDQTASNNAYGTAVSVSAATTASSTVLVGQVHIFNQTKTYGSSSWDVIGAGQDWATTTLRSYFVKKTVSSSGTQNPGGTLSANENWGGTWIAYK